MTPTTKLLISLFLPIATEILFLALTAQQASAATITVDDGATALAWKKRL
ncbi:MAG: hypothetical protein KAU14_00730 [Thermoplasmata archaeon]|nr:hypothetical protein [Thermoplasmata archaeon]